MLIPVASASHFPAIRDLPQPIAENDLVMLKKLGLAGPLYVLLPDAAKTDAGINALKPLINAVPCCVGPFGPGDDNIAASYLDAGAVHVVFDVDVSVTSNDVQVPEGALERPSVSAIAGTIGSLSSGRVIVRLRGAPLSVDAGPLQTEITAAIAALRAFCTGIIVELNGAAVSGEKLKQLRTHTSSQVRIMAEVAAGMPSIKAVEIGRLHRHEVAVLADGLTAATNEEVDASESDGRLDVASCLAACVRSDRPDGLFTTVVQDETGRTLGLVYSSRESVIEAVRCGRGVYYSRSRGGLWRKGDTSGNFQVLRSLRLDCDSDALLFCVQQMGSLPAFCHLNTRSCWGEDGGLAALERTLQARMVEAPAGSYTKRLFDDHELLRHKLLEEAQELAEATEPDHVAAEAADLLYFALVACVKAGVSIADVEGHLDRRALKVRRRPGDSKPARIAAAKAHFDALRQAGTAAGVGPAGAAAAPSPPSDPAASAAVPVGNPPVVGDKLDEASPSPA